MLRRIDEMAKDVEKQLIAKLQVKKFKLQLDESTLRDSEAILLAYVRDPETICSLRGVFRRTQEVKQFLMM